MAKAERIIHQPQSSPPGEYDLVRAQTVGRETWERFYQVCPIADGVLLEDQSIVTGSNDIQHTLGRKLRGALIVKDNVDTAAFLAGLSADDTGAAVNNTVSQIVFDQTNFDYGSNFDTSNGYFVAPHTGLYTFYASCLLSSVPDGTDLVIDFRINGSAAEGSTWETNYYAMGAAITPIASGGLVCVSLTAADTMQAGIFQAGGANEDIKGDDRYTFFMGRALTGYSINQEELSDTEKVSLLRFYSECNRTASLWVF